MKSLNNYIFENNNEILKDIVSLKFDFGSCKNMPVSTKKERCEKAKAQEAIVINVIKQILTDYKVLSCEEWCNENNITYSPKIDSYYGDIMICKDDKTLYNIDLKVGTGNWLGTPDALSLTNFYNTSNKESNKFIYLCCNETGSKENVIVLASTLYEVQKRKGFVVSVNRSKKLINNDFKYSKIYRNKNVPSADTTSLYEEDFVLTDTVLNNKMF